MMIALINFDLFVVVFLDKTFYYNYLMMIFEKEIDKKEKKDSRQILFSRQLSQGFNIYLLIYVNIIAATLLFFIIYT